MNLYGLRCKQGIPLVLPVPDGGYIRVIILHDIRNPCWYNTQIDAGYNRVSVCITILSKIYFYFTAGIVDTMLKKREEQRLR